ncbi:MAG: hypothetical protein QOK24_1911 [Verrucomicrobiota bacterium]|jgi:hypothetical protein
MNYDALTAWGTLLGAVATFLAVLVALFLEPWRRRRSAPRLWLTWRDRDSTRERDADNHQKIFVRLYVQNVGKGAAQRVEVVMGDVCQVFAGDSLKMVSNFLPTALIWTHSESPVCAYLPGQASRLCDLGIFSASGRADTSLAHHGPTFFRCSTQTQPKNEYNYFKTGSYIARLVASASNAKPSQQMVMFTVGEHVPSGGGQQNADFSLVPLSPQLSSNYSRFLSNQERSI